MLEYFKEDFNRDLAKFYFFDFISRFPVAPLTTIYYMYISGGDIYGASVAFALGSIFHFLLDAPFSYLGDKYGHKKIVFLGFVFYFGYFVNMYFLSGFYSFLASMIFLNIGLACFLNSKIALSHDFLKHYNKDDKFSEIFGKISGRIAFLAGIIALLFPFIYSYSKPLPFIIWGVFQFAFSFIVFTFSFDDKAKNNLSNIGNDKKGDKFSFLDGLFKVYSLGLLPFAFFFGFIKELFLSEAQFRMIYVEYIGTPVYLFGAIMFLSRIFHFLFGEKIHKIKEKFNFKEFIIFDTIIFSTLLLTIYLVDFSYMITIIIFSIIIGYFWSRMSIISHYIFEYSKDSLNYKATILAGFSIISNMFSVLLPFLFGYLYHNYIGDVYFFNFVFVIISSIIPIYYLYIKKVR